MREAGRYSNSARDCPSYIGTGMTAPRDPTAEATPTATGLSARRSVLSPKGYVILNKQVCSAFIIFIDPN